MNKFLHFATVIFFQVNKGLLTKTYVYMILNAIWCGNGNRLRLLCSKRRTNSTQAQDEMTSSGTPTNGENSEEKQLFR